MGRIVIVGYKPKPQQEKTLLRLVKSHWEQLHQLELVTDRKPIIMIAKDSTVIEVFEWYSEKSIEDAHSNAAVLAIWETFTKVCDYVPISKLPEASELFSEFSPVN